MKICCREPIPVSGVGGIKIKVAQNDLKQNLVLEFLKSDEFLII